MSTRATIHFMYPGESKPAAIIYRHGDGYPEGLGLDLQRFVKEVKETVDDKRFDDACYLAAKWVVWDARQMSMYSHQSKITPLAFLSVGLCRKTPAILNTGIASSVTANQL